MTSNAQIRIGPLRLTPATCAVFAAVGFLWATLVNLHRYGGSAFQQPQVLATLSFWVFAIAAVWLLEDLDERFNSALTRLWNRGALEMTESQLNQFRLEVQSKANFVSGVCGVLGLILWATFYGSVLVGSGQFPSSHALMQYPFEAGVSFIGGIFIGRALVHAFVGKHLQKRAYHLRIMPGHPDGAAGVAPIGDLFLRQALVLLLPALYFVIGWAVLTIAKDAGTSLIDQQRWTAYYNDWAATYMLMFLAMMAVQAVGFFAPMWLFHVEMQRQKDEQLVLADELSERITEVKAQLAYEADDGQFSLLKERINEMISHHQEIESLPSWPLSSAIRRKFALSNLAVSLPVLLPIWQEASTLFVRGG